MKIRVLSVLLVLVFGLSFVLAEDAANCPAGEKKDCKQKCDKFVDKDNDGKCDKPCDKEAASCCAKDKAACEAKKDGKCPADCTKACCKDKKAAACSADGGKTVISVNGKCLKKCDMDAMVKARMDLMAKNPMMKANEEQMSNIKNQITNMYSEMFIMETLIDEKLGDYKISLTDEDYQKKIEEIAAQQNLSKEQFLEQVSQNLPEKELQTRIRLGMKMESLMDKASEGKIDEVTEADAKTYYEQNAQRFSEPEQVRASHILISTQNKSDEDKASAKKKAEELLKKAKADDADFAALAKENSDCPSKDRGGDLDYFTRERMVPEFSQAAFAMKVGDVSDLVETQFGYHIIKVTDHKDAKTSSFDEVKDEIVKTLQNQKESEFARQYLEDLKAQAKIERSGEAQEQAGIEIKREG